MTEHVASAEAALRWAWTIRQLYTATIGIPQQPRYPQPYTQPLSQTQ